MIVFQKWVVSVVVGCAAGALMSGCGITSKKLDEAEARINILSRQGVSDSLLSDARVLLVQIKTSKQYGGGVSPQKLYDSVMTMLAKADITYTGTAAKLKPAVDSMRKSFDARRQGLTGLQMKEADSLIKDIDALIKKNKWEEVKARCDEADSVLRSLTKDEKVAQETKSKLIGSWTGIQKVKNKEDKSDFIEKKVFTFFSDGKTDMVEERNGQTNEALKEDWKYLSAGSYSLKADTIFLTITKEKCVKQAYMNLIEKNGKPQWIKTEKPSYDSVITSGKKDRFITFNYLKESFKKR